MRRVVALASLLCLSCLIAAQTPAHQSNEKTFTSTDGTLRFSYSRWLVACERDPHQSGWWIPEESCEAVIPVCSNIAGESEATLACIAYPAGDLKKDTNFEGGALSVSELKGPDTERKCQSVLDLSHTAFHRETINGARFDVTEMDGAATGSREDRRVYRNFHKGKCYELDIVITSSDMYEPGTVKKFDSEKVRGALNTILESFEFLK